MRSVWDAVGLLIVMALVFWVGVIWSASEDRRPVVVCKPVHEIVSVVEGLMGNGAAKDSHGSASNPTWEDRVRMACLKGVDQLLSKPAQKQ